MKIHMETQRLLIREIRDEDEQGMLELDADPEVHKYLGNNPITTIEQARAVIKFIHQQYRENGIGRWAVIEKETADFIGWTGLKLITEKTNGHVNYYDMGYRLIRKYWGKGYATETAKASLKYGFDTLQLNEIYAIANIKNEASNHILEKIGLQLLQKFDYKGEAHHWYKITNEKWTVIKNQGAFI
jgi:ribosomal-protein-alanine N-acetyltransferase